MYILYEKGGSIVIDNKSFKNTFCDEKKFKKYHIDLDKIEIRTTSQKESICGGNKNEL